jgi:hypothetical protein
MPRHGSPALGLFPDTTVGFCLCVQPNRLEEGLPVLVTM